ncbi:glutathione S-transferase family protein [Roseomonas sp. CCTCC AB2023176]|uniref:glutathione S-transferase family protein n=1 Tax=Roseomonas sp. CCTCC AB2023176 TaxID=3342640 RepID=UPI0035D6CAF5
MTIEIAALSWVPPFARGHVRDLRVRWALEEAGLSYRTVLRDPRQPASEEYRRWQPFGQVPAYRDGEVELFESGAIILHLAAESEALAPPGRAGLSRVASWTIAALNTLEPIVLEFAAINVFHAGEAWTVERRPQVEAALHRRLAQVEQALGDRDYLEGRFTGADIVMVTLLRQLERPGLLAVHPALDAYRRRGEARPAFARALAAQLGDFEREAA